MAHIILQQMSVMIKLKLETFVQASMYDIQKDGQVLNSMISIDKSPYKFF